MTKKYCRTLLCLVGLGLGLIAGCGDDGAPPLPTTALVFVSDVVSDHCRLAVRVYDPATRVDYRDALERLETFPAQYDTDPGTWDVEFYENFFDCPQGVLFDESITVVEGERRLYVVSNRSGAGAEELLSYDVSSLPMDEQALVIVNLSGAPASVGVDGNADGAADAPVDVANDAMTITLAPRNGTTQTFVASGSLGVARQTVTHSDFYDWHVDYTVCSVVSDRAGGVSLACEQVARTYL
ncbi:MAG: hypothetical protein H6725_06275 [Sandaracinaceae bacterium]|nr:hypothetical protein [Sandaracinaceae bacterium]